MKIKEITEGEVTLKPMPGAQEVDIDGKPVGTATTPAAATAIADLAKKGEFTPTDPNQPTSEEQDKDTMDSGHNHPVGGDGTDQFIQDVIDADAERAAGYSPEVAEEDFLGFGNKSAEEWAKTSPQMAKLLQLQKAYQGTPYQSQVEKRISLLKDRLDMDQGEVAGPGGAPKEIVPPEKFNANQLKQEDPEEAAPEATPEPEQAPVAEDAELARWRKIAGLA